MRRRVRLVDMKKGDAGTVVEIRGGRHMSRRLEVLGVRPGKRIEKSGGSFLRGPVMVMLGNARVAIGIGMASRIVVELAAGDEE